MKQSLLAATIAAATLFAGIAQAAPIVFPSKGQSPAQQQKDEADCHIWAVNRTGFDPGYASKPQVKPQAAEGGLFRGAAKGALVGAAIGAISGDTGKGAAIGAIGAGAAGHSRRRNQYRRMAAEQHALEQEQARQRQEYQRARAACLEGKGYTVK